MFQQREKHKDLPELILNTLLAILLPILTPKCG